MAEPRTFPAQASAENRRFRRNRFTLPVHYAPLKQGDLPKPIPGLARDLGAGGMAITCDRRLEPDELLTLNLYLPPLDVFQQQPSAAPARDRSYRPVTILSRVVWCRPQGARFQIGLQFLDIPRRQRKVLKHFLVEFELDEPLQSR